MTDKDEFEDLDDLSDMAAAMAALGAGVSLEEAAETCSDLLKEFQRYHPLKTAATFGALLTKKRLQPNCLRLELLVHLALASCRGPRVPTAQLLTKGYSLAGQGLGHMEDPPEDIFVGNIYSLRGNYKVLEGIWESGTFYLQRFVNLADSLPDSDIYRWFANAIHALLKVSDIVCTRAGLKRNELGNQDGEDSLPLDLVSQPDKLRQLVQFGFDELEQAEIDIGHLSPFIFDPADRTNLLKQSISSSALEARPLAVEGNQLYLVLPSAVSSAIRRFFLAMLGSGPHRQNFIYNLGNEYSRLLHDTPVLGRKFHRVRFSHHPWGSISQALHHVDEGRYLHLVFFMDTLEEFDPEGFGGMYLGSQQSEEEIERLVTKTRLEASKQAGFQSGLTLYIVCGVGRGAAFAFGGEPQPNWQGEFLSIADYCTLCRVKGISAINLWRINEMKSRLRQMNVWFQNINGFLNFYAWVESLNGHLVPHADVPEQKSADQGLNIAIVQNSILKLRHMVTSSVDFHVEQFVDGTWRLVHTEGTSYFDEDNEQPVYGHLQLEEEVRFLGACITSNRCWWFEAVCSGDEPSHTTYDRWKMLGTWLARAVRPLESAFSTHLRPGPILWRCVFEPYIDKLDDEAYGTFEDAENAIQIVIDSTDGTVELAIGQGFNQAIFSPYNIAERALVCALVKGVAQLADNKTIAIDSLVNEIVPNTEARHSHMFPAQSFRDFIRTLVEKEPITISSFDNASVCLGMGWRARDFNDGNRVEGKASCITFLNNLVKQLEDELCQELSQFNRLALLSKLLLNNETASVSRERWHRTAAAILALRENKVATLRSMREHEQSLNAIFQAGRNLIEMALCESATEGGRVPGEIDLSRLLAKASQLFHVGGWSDLIRWNVLEPFVIIRPLGDVHVKHDFMDTVLDGFGNATSEYRYNASVKNYAKNLERPKVYEDLGREIEAEFLKAWQDEFGCSVDEFRQFVDSIENWAIENQKPVIQMRRSELAGLAASRHIALIILQNLSLTARPNWRQLPDGYDSRDIAPWRFRRRLSVLRRPLLQLTDEVDPLVIFAPGMLREGVTYMFRNYYEGSYPDTHLGPAMRRYAGIARERDGMQFNKKVVDRMEALGWQAQPEVAVTKILRRAFPRNFGDVDVLAWDVDSGRVLVMECKDLQFKKTYGEIGEQLNDFRGEVSASGKRDLLRKHLDRVELLCSHQAEVKKYLGISGDIKIESHLVFSNPVPMQFASGTISQSAELHIFDDLDRLSLK
ncbi:hypothetical protein SAMN05428966_101660 [Massilia sp. PDC64]|nr:zinc chelation protein SecC [Massilia sp. PDC64]SDC37274.1 hypothetical protein SAMN05428966_101660 [Massilia sp. PDC64]